MAFLNRVPFCVNKQKGAKKSPDLNNADKMSSAISCQRGWRGDGRPAVQWPLVRRSAFVLVVFSSAKERGEERKDQNGSVSLAVTGLFKLAQSKHTADFCAFCEQNTDLSPALNVLS